MTIDSYLWINLGFAGFIALIFIIGRTRLRAPVRLNLKNNWSKSLDIRNQKSYGISKEAVGESFAGVEVKSLNIIFMYNGHNWDAHEVLGVPAGSRMEVVTRAYEAALSNSAPESKEFLETAYMAICKK